MTDSLQHKLDRVRRPRVQITYDVETGGAQEIKELPFVVGVMADLSGQPKEAPKPLKERKFVPIDRDNFNDVLDKSSPRVAVQVPNRLTGEAGQMLAAEVTFKNMDDFEPAAVARQIPALKTLLEMRDQLNQLLGKMEGNDKLAERLSEILTNAEQAKELATEMGIEPQTK